MRRIVLILGAASALLLALLIALPFLIDANQFRLPLETELSTGLGREVKLGSLKVALFSGALSASDVTIGDDPAFSKTPFLRAQSFKVGVEMLPLILSRKLTVTGITIDEPQIDLIENSAGVFNFSSIGANSGSVPVSAPATQQGDTPDLTVALLKISRGRITLEKKGSKTKPLILDNLTLDVKNFSANSKFPFSFGAELSGGGTINLDGTAGPVDIGDAVQTPLNARVKATHLDLARFFDPATGIAGIASLNGSAESVNRAVNVAGKLTAEKLVLAKGGSPANRPVEVDVAISHSLAKQSGEIRSIAIRLGSAVANLRGKYRLETDPATVDVKLTGSKMPLAELATFLAPLNIALPSGASIDQGTANLNLSSAGRLDQLVTQGTVAAENARVSKYDFASKLQVLHQFTGIKAQPHTTIETLSANVRNTTAGATLDNLQFAIASIGALRGAGTISPSHALDFKMRAALGGGALLSLAGEDGIPFTIQGTAENPSIKPDVRGVVTDRLKDLTGGKSPADAAGRLLNGFFGKKKPQ